MSKTLKRVLIALLCVVLALLLVVGGYVLYIVLQYSRIDDHQPLEVLNNPDRAVEVGGTYTAMTYNIGFGAYEHGFSFFMDSGVMNDGTAVTGTDSRAASLAVVEHNTEGVLLAAEATDPDFLLMQEVDVDADRSWHVDQAAALRGGFADHASVFASNFHSAYLFYPVTRPHGKVESGLLSLSRYGVEDAERRSFPVDNSFPTKFFDLDRCFSVMRLPVEGAQGRQLVVVNTHMSAYDEGGLIRAAQMEMLAAALAAERAAGNWVVVGGDYNHALGGMVEAFPSQQHVPQWVAVFDDASLPEGFSVVVADNMAQVATCRSTDLPYQPGVNYSTVLDGFIVSDNVEARAVNVDTNFEYSDHNPVELFFTLK